MIDLAMVLIVDHWVPAMATVALSEVGDLTLPEADGDVVRVYEVDIQPVHLTDRLVDG